MFSKRKKEKVESSTASVNSAAAVIAAPPPALKSPTLDEIEKPMNHLSVDSVDSKNYLGSTLLRSESPPRTVAYPKPTSLQRIRSAGFSVATGSMFSRIHRPISNASAFILPIQKSVKHARPEDLEIEMNIEGYEFVKENEKIDEQDKKCCSSNCLVFWLIISIFLNVGLIVYIVLLENFIDDSDELDDELNSTRNILIFF